MEIAEHIASIRRDGPLLSAAARQASLDAPVPTCPQWSVRDLVRHQGGVHRWATSIVTVPRTERWNVDLPEVVGSWPDDDALFDWFDAGVRSLVTALEQADPELACWTFLRAPSPLAMWARRQAHETGVHRVDAELAAGPRVSPFAAPFAADGIDELLTCFITRRPSSLRAPQPRTLGVRCADDDSGWLVWIGPDSVRTTAIGDAEPDCTVRGRAEDVYLTLWSRASPDAVTVTGDQGVLGMFLEHAHVRWAARAG